jgi:hypothetical protein
MVETLTILYLFISGMFTFFIVKMLNGFRKQLFIILVYLKMLSDD